MCRLPNWTEFSDQNVASPHLRCRVQLIFDGHVAGDGLPCVHRSLWIHDADDADSKNDCYYFDCLHLSYRLNLNYYFYCYYYYWSLLLWLLALMMLLILLTKQVRVQKILNSLSVLIRACFFTHKHESKRK
jgi:hypothetical protein